MKQFFLAILIATAALLPGCKSKDSTSSPSKTKYIVILTNASSPFWDAAAKGASEAAKELKLDEAGYEVRFDRNDGKVQHQIEKLKSYANSTDVVGVAVSVLNAENQAIAEELKNLQDKGIHVVTIDSDVASSAQDSRTAYLGTRNFVAGRELGKAVNNLKPEGGKYATFVGVKSAANAQERIKGFTEGAGEKFEQVENLADGVDTNVARTNVKDALDRNDDLSVLVGIWSYNPPAIVDIVTEKNIREKVLIAAFDAEPQSISAMNEGNIDVMIVQNPFQMGYQGVKLLKALLEKDTKTIGEILPEKDKEGGDLYDTGLKIVVPNDNTTLKKEMFDESIELMKLEEFQKWLDKYSLQGS